MQIQEQTLLNEMKPGNRGDVTLEYPHICASYWAENHAPKASFFVEKAPLSDRGDCTCSFCHIPDRDECAYRMDHEDGRRQGDEGRDHILSACVC